jgi:hypothetical protein
MRLYLRKKILLQRYFSSKDPLKYCGKAYRYCNAGYTHLQRAA